MGTWSGRVPRHRPDRSSAVGRPSDRAAPCGAPSTADPADRRAADTREVEDMGALDGRIAIITGAGRGIGREYALLFAAEGAKVVVNDLGGSLDGSGDDVSAAQQVVDEITAAGGEAVANHDDVTDWEGGKRLIDTAIDHLRRPARPGQQRRHPARPGAGQHDRGGVGRRHPRPPEGSLRPHPPRRRVLARADQGRAGRSRRRWSTPRRPRGCSATPARPTTARPRPASPPSPPSPPPSCPATGCG